MTIKYIMVDNATGDKYITEFKPDDFHLSIKNNDGLPNTWCQAVLQLDVWNRAQRNYKNEFTYSMFEG